MYGNFFSHFYRGVQPQQQQRAQPAPRPQFGGMWGRILGPMMQRGMQQQQPQQTPYRPGADMSIQPQQQQAPMRRYGRNMGRRIMSRYGQQPAGPNALNQPVKPTAPRIMGGGGVY
jgi:hypothetical protein